MWSSPSNLLTPENWKDLILGPPKLNDPLPVLKKNQQMKNSQLQQSLLLVLQAEGIRHRSKEGDGNVKNTHHLRPLLDDLVLTLVNKQRHLGRITGLPTGLDNVVKLQTVYHGSGTELDRHVRTLVLVFLWTSLLTRITTSLPLWRMKEASRTNLAGQGISCSALVSTHYQVKMSLILGFDR